MGDSKALIAKIPELADLTEQEWLLISPVITHRRTKR